MNLSALRTATRTRLGVPATDPLLTDTNLTDLINSANHYLETEWDWAWLETAETIATVIGAATLTPAATWQRTIDLRLTSGGVVLRRAPIEEIDFLSSAGTGEPRLWCVTGATITVFPTPSAIVSLTHRFVRTEPDLVADGDIPLVPSSFHSAIVEYAAHLAYRRTRSEDKAKVALDAYETWLAQMKRRADRYADTRGGGAQAEAVAKP